MHLSDAADETLVRKAKDGDATAFGLLIERHQSAVTAYLLDLLQDPDRAEETAQRAFVEAYRHLSGFRGDARFMTWVSRIALNEARSQFRYARTRGWLALEDLRGEDGWSWEDRVIAARDRSQQEQASVEVAHDLRRAMGALTQRERDVAALRLKGCPLHEIGKTLGVSEGTVKSTLFSAKEKLKEAFLSPRRAGPSPCAVAMRGQPAVAYQ